MKSYSIAQPTVGWAERRAVRRVLQSGWMTQGPAVERFEAAFARMMDVDPRKVVACNNGTSALTVALMTLRPAGGVCALPSLTYAGTLNAVAAAGLLPCLTDVSTMTWCMTPHDLSQAEARAEAVGEKVRAVVPVHLYGYLSSVTSSSLHRTRDPDSFDGFAPLMPVVEDACEALGASDAHGKAGKRGTAGVFSFFANKQMTTLGEGGVIVAHTEDDAIDMRCVRGQGQDERRRYVHRRIGINARMMEAQAAFGIVQLVRLQSGQSDTRNELLNDYRDAIFEGYCAEITMREPMREPAQEAAWLAAVRVPYDVRANMIVERLAGVGVEARPMFWPLHAMPFMRAVGHVDDPRPTLDNDAFLNSTTIARTALALPLHTGLRRRDVRTIVALLSGVLAEIKNEGPKENVARLRP